MNTIVVWTLVVLMHGYHDPAALVIDNISSQQNCEALVKTIRSMDSRADLASTRCIAVRKVR